MRSSTPVTFPHDRDRGAVVTWKDIHERANGCISVIAGTSDAIVGSEISFNKKEGISVSILFHRKYIEHQRTSILGNLACLANDLGRDKGMWFSVIRCRILRDVIIVGAIS